MKSLIFEKIRCFSDEHDCELKPITILIGENSTGKSTFLALTRIIWDVITGRSTIDYFNEEPFLLGSYDQIATLRRARAKYFKIGLTFDLLAKETIIEKSSFENKVSIIAEFVRKGAESNINKWIIKSGSLVFKIIFNPEQEDIGLNITINKGSNSIVIDRERFKARLFYPFRYIRPINIQSILHFIQFLFHEDTPRKKVIKSILLPADEGIIENIIIFLNQYMVSRPYAFAPIRTRPQRTYDPRKDLPQPEGSHIPMVLSNLLLSKDENSKLICESLTNFGIESGLFKSVRIRRKGEKESDPFQITVKTANSFINLVDVGYGVSQILPIIVETLRSPKESTFLLQQPEVHLHPKAQAELGSFFLTLAKEQKKQFIIETHSDYLLDRIRMDIRDKKNLNPQDVVIYFFEKNEKAMVKIHKIEIDKNGEFLSVPPCYRKFFLDEERRYLLGN